MDKPSRAFKVSGNILWRSYEYKPSQLNAKARLRSLMTQKLKEVTREWVKHKDIERQARGEALVKHEASQSPPMSDIQDIFNAPNAPLMNDFNAVRSLEG